LAGRGARQQQVCDVGAGNQQHEHNGDQQNEQSGFQIGSDQGIEQTEQVNSPIAHFRILFADAGGDGIHFGLRLLRRDSGFEFPEDDDYVVEAEFLAGIDDQRCIDIAAAEQFQTGRGDADDRGGDSIQRNGSADEIGICIEAALPQTFADHGDGGAAGLFFVRPEVAASERPGAEHLRQGGADAVSGELLGLAISTQSEGGVTHSGELLERLGLLAPGKKIQHGSGERRQVQLVVFFRDLHDPVRLGEGQRPDHDRVHDREDGRIGGNGERNGEDHGGGEQRRPAHDANRVANVSPESVVVEHGCLDGSNLVWTDRTLK
jgi:hypothetical protein